MTAGDIRYLLALDLTIAEMRTAPAAPKKQSKQNSKRMTMTNNEPIEPKSSAPAG